MGYKKIAILKYEGQVDIHLFNIANILDKQGHEVTIYYSYCKSNISSKYLRSTIKIIDIQPKNLVLKILSFIYAFLLHKIKLYYIFPISPVTLILSRRKISSNNTDIVIAIEKQALLWADRLRIHCPKIYYSLELYIPGHPLLESEYWRYLHELEKKAHSNCMYTIIQDDYRAELLYSANNISKTKIPYIKIPVSINSPKQPNKFNYFHFKYNLRSTDIIVLYFGKFGFNRMLDFEQIGSNIKSEYKIIIHGLGPQNGSIENNNIIFCEDYMDEEGINVVMASIDIGLALYSNDNSNNLHTAFSSEKIARYLQCGVPFISLNNISFQSLKNEFNCCELVESYEEIPSAIYKISNDYANYKSNAFKAFNKYYYFSAISEDFVNKIKNIV